MLNSKNFFQEKKTRFENFLILNAHNQQKKYKKKIR